MVIGCLLGMGIVLMFHAYFVAEPMPEITDNELLEAKKKFDNCGYVNMDIGKYEEKSHEK